MGKPKSERMTPPDVTCAKCGQSSRLHAIQYIYKKYIADGHVKDSLSSLVTVIECPGCGVQTQTDSMDEPVPRLD
jgi:hypothetical protein